MIEPRHIHAVTEVVQVTGKSAHDRRPEYGNVSQPVWAVAVAVDLDPQTLQAAVEAYADALDQGRDVTEALRYGANAANLTA